MNKPNSYEEVQVGDFIPVELGAHYGVIKNVEEMQSKTGKPMVKVSIDFDKADAQPGYFMEMFKNDIRPEKKYPNQATHYIMTEDNEGKCNRSFKSFLKAFEDSNKATTVWGEKFAGQFKNKKIGIVFGEVEEEYNGERKMRRKIRWFCDYAKVPDQKVPEARLMPAATSPAQSDNNFVNVPDGVDEEIPF